MAESFNTLDAAKRLEEAGCDPGVAGAVVREINGAIAGNVATKADIELVRKEMETLATKEMLREEIGSLRTELAKQHTRVILWVFAMGGGLLAASRFLEFLGW